MNGRQRRFAEEYSLDHNGAAAAVRAGYSETRARQTASELLQRPDVAQAISKLDTAKREELGVEAEDITEGLRQFAEGALEGRYPGSVGVRALEVLAKVTGLFSQPSDHLQDREVVFTYRVGDESKPAYSLQLDRDLGDSAEQ